MPCSCASGVYAAAKLRSGLRLPPPPRPHPRAAVAKFAQEHKITIAVVGPEGPLEAGVADALWAVGVKCVGPKQNLAQLESSKAFTRNLLINNGIGACPKYAVAKSLDDCRAFFASLPPLAYVVKADGLCGGKGVKVGGEHLMSDAESLAFCAELLEAGGEAAQVVLEEKLIGQEFSLMSFCDGEACAHIPPIQVRGPLLLSRAVPMPLRSRCW